MRADAHPPHTLDVSHLPASALDARHPIWWGNTLLLAVESTILTLVLVTYIYLRKNFDVWPPPRVNAGVPLLGPAPELAIGTWNLLLWLASCVPMVWIDRTARRHLHDSAALSADPERRAARSKRAPSAAKYGFMGVLVLLAVAGLVAIVLRFQEFPGLRFTWDDNAYGSVIWGLLVLHLTYLLMSEVEVVLLTIWVARQGLSDKFASDATLMAASWYWTAAVWVVIYAFVYWGPRLT